MTAKGNDLDLEATIRRPTRRGFLKGMSLTVAALGVGGAGRKVARAAGQTQATAPVKFKE
jgi:hypothetical protein